MKKVLMISNKVMHYRVSVYNYFYEKFKENGYELIVRANELQKENKHDLKFDFKEIPFKFSFYKNEIKSINPDSVILFLHLKDKVIWPLVHWLKLKRIPFTFWTKGANLDDPDNKIRNYFFRYLHNISDGLILYSANEKHFIKKKNRHKISVANNTVNFADYPAIEDSVQAIKAEFKIPFKKVALFVGRMEVRGGRKKVNHAIQIFNEINQPDYGLVIVGSGYSHEFQAQANAKNILYLGEIHDPENIQISKVFKMADLFLMPGHVGLGLNQAFYWGLPVLTEKGDQPPEINYLIDSRNGYIVEEDDVPALKNKMMLLFDNDDLRGQFSKAAKQDIMTHASIDNMFNGFLENIKKIENK